MQLPRSHVSVLEAVDADTAWPIETIAERIDLPPATVTRAAFELEDDGLLEVDERDEETTTLTDEGRRYVEDGLPEQRLFEVALEAAGSDGSVSLGTLSASDELSGETFDVALSNFARKGFGRIDSGSLHLDSSADPADDDEFQALKAIATADEQWDDGVDAEIVDQLERRGLIERSSRTVREISLSEDGITALMEGVESAETVSRLTPELLTTGRWREVEFSAYNVEADAEEIDGGRVHILRQTAERVKDVLVGMGFKEMDGPHVDADFWINDCLFMPQDHPARTHWDRFAVESPDRIEELPAGLVERVESAHREGVGEDGEGYHSPWEEDFARALALRGHTTSLSARYLAGHQIGELEPPERFFSVEKVYRNDTLDPTHLLEFFQIEGWVMAEGLSVRDLMGTFEEFYARFGIHDLEFKPHYNPYTEPSFELFGTHPTTGELVEIGNSGIFREEMLEPLEVDCDVMAWGLALERLLMLMYGFEDIRDIHGTLCDLELLRETEVTY